MKLNTGIAIDEGQLIWWEKKGLLKEVARKDKNRRNYSSLNANLAIVIMVCKMFRWHLQEVEELIKNQDKERKELFISQCKVLLDKLPKKLDNIVKEIDRII